MNPFFPFCFGPDDGRISDGLKSSRRLFGQPEWIANADITFDQPDWGTQMTLAFFAISDVLDAAGGPTFIDSGGFVQRFSLDRYIQSFHTLDLVMSQRWSPDWLRGGDIVFKFRIKNLTDSVRGVIYDPVATDGEIPERRFRVGRNYKLSVTYSF